MEREAGRVVRWMRGHHYGWIRPLGADRDLYVHQKWIETSGWRELTKGMTVSFVRSMDGRTGKPCAQCVRIQQGEV